MRGTMTAFVACCAAASTCDALQPCRINEFVELDNADATQQSPVGMSVSVEDERAFAGYPLGTDGGFVVQYLRNGATWPLVTQWDNPDPDMDPSGDEFGAAVTYTNGWLIVGAPGEGGTGAAYAFNVESLADPGTRLVPAGGLSAGDEYGAAVYAKKDALVVGAPGTDADAGAAYAFHLESGSWTFEQELVPDTPPAPGDRYAESVGVVGDQLLFPSYPGYAIVGAPEAQADAKASAGLVHTFERGPVGAWPFVETLQSPAPAEDGRFGASVAVSQDAITLESWGIVGEPGADDDRGAAHIYGLEIQGTIWDHVATLQSPLPGTPQVLERYATAVAISDRVALVGEPFASLPTKPTMDEAEANKETITGAAYVYSALDGPWTHEATLRVDEMKRFGQFGVALDLHGEQAVVGAPDEPMVGAAYLYRALEDCDENGQLDACEIADDPALDADADGDLDACDFSDCYADFDGDDSLNIRDWIAFDLAFKASDHAADCNNDGAFSILDYVCFMQEFLAGCI